MEAVTSVDRGDWMQLYSGERFYPLDPRPEDITSEDVAHALSNICRYAGHVDRFYSVAEHCVKMSEVVDPEHALAALLHDATEAYVVDVPRPLKRYLPDYQAIENRVWRAITLKYGLDMTLPAQVKEFDTRILLNERDELMSRTRYSWEEDTEYQPLPLTIEGWVPEIAEGRYLQRLDSLFNARKSDGV